MAPPYAQWLHFSGHSRQYLAHDLEQIGDANASLQSILSSSHQYCIVNHPISAYALQSTQVVMSSLLPQHAHLATIGSQHLSTTR